MFFLIIPRLGLGHHHFTELVEIHGAGAILQKDNDVLQNIFSKCSCSPIRQHHYLVQFLNDSFQLLISQGGEQFTCAEWENEKLQARNVCRTNKAPQGLGCDEALALLVVDPEGVLQLLLHRLHVRVLDQEGGAQLAELTCGHDLFSLTSRL